MSRPCTGRQADTSDIDNRVGQIRTMSIIVKNPKYLTQLKNDKESVLMLLMREPAGACPDHVQEGRPTPQALILGPAGACPGHVQEGRPTIQTFVTGLAGSGPGCVQAGRPTDQTYYNSQDC
jgi:hypothetical protein